MECKKEVFRLDEKLLVSRCEPNAPWKEKNSAQRVGNSSTKKLFLILLGPFETCDHRLTVNPGFKFYTSFSISLSHCYSYLPLGLGTCNSIPCRNSATCFFSFFIKESNGDWSTLGESLFFNLKQPFYLVEKKKAWNFTSTVPQWSTPLSNFLKLIYKRCLRVSGRIIDSLLLVSLQLICKTGKDSIAFTIVRFFGSNNACQLFSFPWLTIFPQKDIVSLLIYP